jgi:hypothetical protein
VRCGRRRAQRAGEAAAGCGRGVEAEGAGDEEGVNSCVSAAARDDGLPEGKGRQCAAVEGVRSVDGLSSVALLHSR